MIHINQIFIFIIAIFLILFTALLLKHSHSYHTPKNKYPSNKQSSISAKQLYKIIIIRYSLIEFCAVRKSIFKLNQIFSFTLFLLIQTLKPNIYQQYWTWILGSIICVICILMDIKLYIRYKNEFKQQEVNIFELAHLVFYGCVSMICSVILVSISFWNYYLVIEWLGILKNVGVNMIIDQMLGRPITLLVFCNIIKKVKYIRMQQIRQIYEQEVEQQVMGQNIESEFGSCNVKKQVFGFNVRKIKIEKGEGTQKIIQLQRGNTISYDTDQNKKLQTNDQLKYLANSTFIHKIQPQQLYQIRQTRQQFTNLQLLNHHNSNLKLNQSPSKNSIKQQQVTVLKSSNHQIKQQINQPQKLSPLQQKIQNQSIPQSFNNQQQKLHNIYKLQYISNVKLDPYSLQPQPSINIQSQIQPIYQINPQIKQNINQIPQRIKQIYDFDNINQQEDQLACVEFQLKKPNSNSIKQRLKSTQYFNEIDQNIKNNKEICEQINLDNIQNIQFPNIKNMLQLIEDKQNKNRIKSRQNKNEERTDYLSIKKYQNQNQELSQLDLNIPVRLKNMQNSNKKKLQIGKNNNKCESKIKNKTKMTNVRKFSNNGSPYLQYLPNLLSKQIQSNKNLTKIISSPNRLKKPIIKNQQKSLNQLTIYNL